MGTELSKTDAGDACNPVKGSTCTLSSQQQMDLILQWRTWMAGAEDLFVQGKFKACREVSVVSPVSVSKTILWFLK